MGTAGYHGVPLPSHPTPRTTFSNHCLQLPCIVFSVARIGVQELSGSQGNLYRATVSLPGRVEFRTADAMPPTRTKPPKLVPLHPWRRDLLDLLDGFMSDDERVAESDADLLGDGTNDASEPVSSLHAEPSTFQLYTGVAADCTSRVSIQRVLTRAAVRPIQTRRY
jgi:hypothetical protein